VNARQSTDLVGPSLRYPHGQEAGEAALSIRDSERGVAGPSCRASRAEDAS
jgi:hypothetical protein